MSGNFSFSARIIVYENGVVMIYSDSIICAFVINPDVKHCISQTFKFICL